jgi:hypothetical protein
LGSQDDNKRADAFFARYGLDTMVKWAVCVEMIPP